MTRSLRVFVYITTLLICNNLNSQVFKLKDIQNREVELNLKAFSNYVWVFYLPITCNPCYLDLFKFLNKKKLNYGVIALSDKTLRSKKVYMKRILKLGAKKKGKFYFEEVSDPSALTVNALPKDGIFQYFSITKTPHIIFMNDSIRSRPYHQLLDEGNKLADEVKNELVKIKK